MATGLSSRTAEVLPRRWPNSVAEQHSVRKIFDTFRYPILSDLAVATDKTDSKHNGIELMHSWNNANPTGPNSYCREL